MPEVSVTRYVEYTIFVPGLTAPFFVKLPEGSPPPIVTASPGALANAPGIVPDTSIGRLLRIKLPARLFRRHPSVVEVDGAMRPLSACICAALHLLKTSDVTRFRPETYTKIALELPELLPLLEPDKDRKPVNKVTVYRVHGVSVV